MAALEEQAAPAPSAAPLGTRVPGFVSAGVQPGSGAPEAPVSQAAPTANPEEVELDDEEDGAGIVQKEVPQELFGNLAQAVEMAAED
ncbi:hypothetical protein H632_c946p0 [Helicosporidium sp. ATCC 50920]|nr:hypothetical protein H632_c946p0 [Helicosporidium sp. ATCC 50920]|eukprot:KDD74982.1 hypothetical protein H632_c946p0 [Helicosporidium sp. ATCC 50920]